MSNNNIKLKTFALIFGLIGIGFVLLSIIFHTLHLIDTKRDFLLWLNEFTISFFSHIGIGLIILSIVTFLLEIPHWMNYFEERLKKIVINKSYLEQLDRDDLLELQSSIMKVYFRNDSIGKTGGFFNYYQQNIQSIIGLPFRENVNLNLTIEHCTSNPNLIKVNETLSYQCRQNVGKIQNEVSYIPEINEHINTTDFNLTIQHPTLEASDGKNSVFYDHNKLQELNCLLEDRNGFKLSIEDFNIDGLNVVINATYHTHKNRFFNWVIMYPTHKITINVSYPADLTFLSEKFFNNEKNHTERDDIINSNYNLVNSEWLLPGEGISMQLIEKNYHQNTFCDIAIKV